jgi:hypothetical protein
VGHELALRLCTCAVRESVLHHHGEREVGGCRNRHDGHDLALHLYMYVVRESVLHHHDGRVVPELVLRRCTCAARELGDPLHIDRGNL